ncbi:hypothetical protein B9479_003101 [Cryptococcus floricola]|uniref:CNH domain-containing protein n=1 Tax=Cryptococcus floricola TaxID=2591691 RepID=A0A5D3B236_9TREE|nr:hypothetical protein B9479_003101 [Cryptococcus floricola]
MSFSLAPLPVLTALKHRITAIHHHADRLYLGLANGQLQVYAYDGDGAELLKTIQPGKRQIDQLGVLPTSNLLAVLSDTVVTLYSLPDLTKSAPTLSQARTVHAFSITTYTPKRRKDEPPQEQRDLLVVGCRKKVVVFGAGERGLNEGWELSIPHSPRHIVFPPSPSSASLPTPIHLCFTSTTSALLHLNAESPSSHLTMTDVTTDKYPQSDIPNAGQKEEGAGSGLGIGMGRFTNFGGYVGIGGKNNGPLGVGTVTGEVLLAREDTGVFYSSEGSYTRPTSLRWPAPPDGLAYSNPFIYSVVSAPPPSHAQGQKEGIGGTVQIHLAPTLREFTSLPIPAPSVGSLALGPTATLSTFSSGTTPKLLVTTTPTDKSLLAQGSSVYVLSSPPGDVLVDGLVRKGRVGDAIAFLESTSTLPRLTSPATTAPPTPSSTTSPKPYTLQTLQILQSLQLFAQGQYQTALESFARHNVNPAKVLALYPKGSIAGKLGVVREGWMDLFGGEGGRLEEGAHGEDKGDHPGEGDVKGLLETVKHGLQRTPSHETLSRETASIKTSSPQLKPPAGADLAPEGELPRAALEALMFFLSDRRQKLAQPIASFSSSSSSTTFPSSPPLPPLSALSPAELFALPSLPFSQVSPEELLRMAQIVYTGLVKVYLLARPTLVGSLCRIENWCDVEEVEGLLKEKEKFGDLIDLYQGKKMHRKALEMVHDLAKEEDDPLDRYPPTISYLQKLPSSPPELLQLRFEFSKWILEEDVARGLEIFKGDEPPTSELPRKEVVDFLEGVQPSKKGKKKEACVSYLEWLIVNMGEKEGWAHEKLAELYLDGARLEKGEMFTKLLSFLETSEGYRAGKMLSRLKKDEMPEARAILLGRMGRHEDALKVYVYQLRDYTQAEAYCIKNEKNKTNIFAILLQLYLRPAPSYSSEQLLKPALTLLAAHPSSLPMSSSLPLLPPLTPMSDVQTYLLRTLRSTHSNSYSGKVHAHLSEGRKEQIDLALVAVEGKRVRVGEQRVCPGCMKRLGVAAVAVHAPRGEVTHLHCKDKFSRKLESMRG